LRIVHIITRLNVGGATRALTALIPHLDGEKILIHGSLEKEEGDMAYLFNTLNCEMVKVNSMRRPVSPKDDFLAYSSFVYHLKRLKPDIVHTHLAKAGILGRSAAWTLGINRTVHTYHGNIFEGHFGGLTSRFFLFIERKFARRTSALVAVSQTLMTRLAHLFGTKKRWFVIPPPVNLTSLEDCDRNEARKSFGLNDESPVLGFLGRIVPVKNPLFLIDVLKHLGSEWILLIGGDGESKSTVEKIAQEKGVYKQVRFVGWVRDVAKFYRSCDVFAMSSRTEGFAMGIVEALRFGIPSVALATTGVVDLLDAPLTTDKPFIETEAGFAVYQNDPKTFAHCVRLAYERKSRGEDFTNPFKKIYERCSPSAVAEQYNSLYRSVIRNRL